MKLEHAYMKYDEYSPRLHFRMNGKWGAASYEFFPYTGKLIKITDKDVCDYSSWLFTFTGEYFPSLKFDYDDLFLMIEDKYGMSIDEFSFGILYYA